MFRFNAKAFVGAITAPVSLILVSFFTDGLGFEQPWLAPAIDYAVTAAATGFLTWLVPNRPAPPQPSEGNDER